MIGISTTWTLLMVSSAAKENVNVIVLVTEYLVINPFHSDGLSHAYWYCPFCILRGCLSNFYKMLYFCP